MRVILITLGLVPVLLLGACSSSLNEEASDEPGAVPTATGEVDEAERASDEPNSGSEAADQDDAGAATPAPPATVAPAPAPPATPAPPAPTATPASAPAPTPQPTRAVPEPDTGGESTGPLEDADIEIVTDEGTLQIGEADVPEGVDDAFPVPGDMDVQLSSEAGDQFGFSGVVALSIDELVTFYTEGLVAAGYEITERKEIEGVLAVYAFESGEVEGQVAISDAPGADGSSVLVTIGSGSDAVSVGFGDG